MRISKNEIEKKYNCSITKDSPFDDNHKFWVAWSNDEDKQIGEGVTLKELVEDIEVNLC